MAAIQDSQDGTMEETRRSTVRRVKYLLLAGSLLFTFLIAEIAARVWLKGFATTQQRLDFSLVEDIAPKDWRICPHHYLDFCTSPNFAISGVTHDALGFRGPAFPVKKPEGEFRIVCLGASTTYCTGVHEDAKTYPAQLQQILNSDLGYRNVRVINAGVPGYTSWESLINLEFRVLDLNPDLVIFYEAVNDVHARLVEPAAYRGDNSGYRQQWRFPPTPFLEHSCILRIASRKLGFTSQQGLEGHILAPTARYIKLNASAKEIAILRANPPIYYRRNLLNMIAVCRANGVGMLFATFASCLEKKDHYATQECYQEGIREHNEVMAEVAQSENVPVQDLANLMPTDPRYWWDGVHVNNRGARAHAELVAQFIDQNHLIGQPGAGKVEP